ncbi:hypothetical protein WMY93_032356 [Mugilogobius chulae]|uniref:Uncharacterized protein n=1 Tax=Mugilogobius chulae TaxID=88201 RepID=A0AAW0MV29_9GOBI
MCFICPSRDQRPLVPGGGSGVLGLGLVSESESGGLMHFLFIQQRATQAQTNCCCSLWTLELPTRGTRSVKCVVVWDKLTPSGIKQDRQIGLTGAFPLAQRVCRSPAERKILVRLPLRTSEVCDAFVCVICVCVRRCVRCLQDVSDPQTRSLQSPEAADPEAALSHLQQFNSRVKC